MTRFFLFGIIVFFPPDGRLNTEGSYNNKEVHMITNSNQKSASDAGFFEKNFLKLKSGKLWEYIISRIIMFVVGITLGFYYIFDAAYVHSKDGIPQSVLFAAALIFLMNGIRKMVWGFIKLRDASWDETVVEKPYHRFESFLQRVFLRFPIGQRRHLVSVMALLSEGLVGVLLLASFVAHGLNNQLFVLSGEFPFVLKPFVWSAITFPVNSWMGLAIVAIAQVISYINNSLFLTKIPQVRQAIADTLRRLPNVERMALYFPLQLFNVLREARRMGAHETPCDEVEAAQMAERILNEYPEEVIPSVHKDKLRVELAKLICKEHDPLVLLEFLKKRTLELKNTLS